MYHLYVSFTLAHPQINTSLTSLLQEFGRMFTDLFFISAEYVHIYQERQFHYFPEAFSWPHGLYCFVSFCPEFLLWSENYPCKFKQNL